jgi:hypothetical protein
MKLFLFELFSLEATLHCFQMREFAASELLFSIKGHNICLFFLGFFLRLCGYGDLFSLLLDGLLGFLFVIGMLGMRVIFITGDVGPAIGCCMKVGIRLAWAGVAVTYDMEWYLINIK